MEAQQAENPPEAANQTMVVGFEYEDGCLLGCSAVLSGRSLPTFRRSLLPPSSGRSLIASNYGILAYTKLA
jgi:hypothetical protein